MKNRILAVFLSLILMGQSFTPCFAEELSKGTQGEEALLTEEANGDEETAESELDSDTNNETVADENLLEEAMKEDSLEEIEEAADSDRDIIQEESEESGSDEESVETESEDLLASSASQTYQLNKAITAVLSDGVLTVSGKGAMPNYISKTASPWNSKKDEIKKIIIEEGITSIGNYAFYGCTGVTEISLPNSLLTIGTTAFADNQSLAKLVIPDSVTKIGKAAFANTYKLTDIQLGQKLQTIDAYAFQGCAVTEITIPSSVSSISELAFYGATSLRSIYVDSENSNYTSADGVLLSKDGKTLYLVPINKSGSSYTVPNGVTKIEQNAFLKNANIKEINFPSSLTSIGDWAFAYSNLESLVLPDSVSTIGNGIALSCENLASAFTGNGLETVSYRSFELCSKLAEIRFGSKVKTIDMRAFQDCTSLTNVEIPEGVEKICVYAFKNCTALTKVLIPDSMDQIESAAFEGCSKVQMIYGSATQSTSLTSTKSATSSNTSSSTSTSTSSTSSQNLAKVSYTGNYHYNYSYQVLNLVNQERAKVGLSALTMDKTLLNGAMQRAAETCLDFSHTRPSGKSYGTVCSGVMGENIATGASSASAVMEQWMSSSGHKANILRSNYKSIGIGCFEQGGQIYWVQLFGTKTATTVSKPADKKTTVSIEIDSDTYRYKTSIYREDKSTSAIKAGKSVNLKAQIENPGWDGMKVYSWPNSSSFTWKSSNSSVAKVDSSGKVTGVSVGSAKITATCGCISKSITIKVEEVKATKIKLAISKISAYKGYSYTVKSTLTPSNSTDTVTWTSSNSKVATVSSTGKITMKKVGKAVITARSKSGKTDKVQVVVWPSKKVTKS